MKRRTRFYISMGALALTWLLVFAIHHAHAWERHDWHRFERFDRQPSQQFNSVTIFQDNSQFVGPNERANAQFYGRAHEFDGN